jgi:mono/diheme cytochrome c family protein
MAVFAALLACTPAGAESFDRGQALYENHCRTCHEPEVHQRADRRATSVEDLQRWVATWSWHAVLGWSAEDIADVTDYLNRAYYHFPEPADR